ncbi:MAG TPA: YbaK/EbsC family protein [Pseudonocardia sp.]|nr:YbaK/EbsC family protein [Pseudonocardia sp.]
MQHSTHQRLMSLLESAEVDHRVITHRPEGRTDLASDARGHALSSAAKCMVLTVRDRRRGERIVLAVVPGDRKVDYRKVKGLYDATDVALADRAVAEDATGCVSGCVIPFSLDGGYGVLLDRALLSCREVYFNAARLDVSVALRPKDLLDLAMPLVHVISR